MQVLKKQNPETTAGMRSTLHQAKVGRAVRICELCGSPEVSCRLRELGLHEGAVVRLIACHANIICQVCNMRLALNERLAQLVMVEAVGN